VQVQYSSRTDTSENDRAACRVSVSHHRWRHGDQVWSDEDNCVEARDERGRAEKDAGVWPTAESQCPHRILVYKASVDGETIAEGNKFGHGL
jgi:hypothetical protein